MIALFILHYIAILYVVYLATHVIRPLLIDEIFNIMCPALLKNKESDQLLLILIWLTYIVLLISWCPQLAQSSKPVSLVQLYLDFNSFGSHLVSFFSSKEMWIGSIVTLCHFMNGPIFLSLLNPGSIDPYAIYNVRTNFQWWLFYLQRMTFIPYCWMGPQLWSLVCFYLNYSTNRLTFCI